ncbi:amidohydrolase family protein [Pedobacter sp. AW31-3R]|uniref:amidohydrolase family protein n=1 Tax=Pedobacter sp. AW31-3R TaxID=3445781 RepID=UPI003F9F9DFB
MSSYLSASWIYPVTSAPLKNGVIAISDDGSISAVFTAEEAKRHNLSPITYYEGMLVPGFINTHCHLELSHLAGKIPMHTGLPGFVQQVMQQRAATPTEIEKAMRNADEEMYTNGIVATGDISNQPVSRKSKLDSKLYYHTFVEAMGFDPGRASAIIQQAIATRNDFSPLKATIVPHAPYSVSPELFKEINASSGRADECITIHNQETAEENAFFESKSGHFLKLYAYLGLDISFFKGGGKTSLQTYLPFLSTLPRTLLVHNTFTSREDVSFAENIHPHLFWCLCPNANLYIENRLPDLMLLREMGVKITLGTDSLASNHQLSILAEMKTLQEYFKLSFEELLGWATLNGAEFLGLENQFGSLETGKKPGINLIEFMGNGMLNNNTRIKRLF